VRGKRRDYTEVGKRIAALARYQRDLAAVLGTCQQSVSKKLRGETAILLADLEKLARHYGVSMCYFFDEPDYPSGFAARWKRLRRMPSEAHDLVCLANKLSEADVRKLVEIVKVLTRDTGQACGRPQPPAS